MDDSNKEKSEVERLFDFLNSESVHPDFLEIELKKFSIESKNELVTRLAQTFKPDPQGILLARLPYILTEENKSKTATVFIINLRSPYPESRKFSLYGLEKLGYPGIVDFALHSLKDDNDQVLTAACNILLPIAKQNPSLWKLLQNFYRVNKGKKELYYTNSLLEAHGIEKLESDKN